MAKRKSLGWSARQTSERAGLSPSYVGKVESGELDPSFRAFCKIAFALGMNDTEVVAVVHAQASDLAVTADS